MIFRPGRQFQFPRPPSYCHQTRGIEFRLSTKAVQQNVPSHSRLEVVLPRWADNSDRKEFPQKGAKIRFDKSLKLKLKRL